MREGVCERSCCRIVMPFIQTFIYPSTGTGTGTDTGIHPSIPVFVLKKGCLVLLIHRIPDTAIPPPPQKSLLGAHGYFSIS